LKVYAKAVKRRERLTGAYLEAFDRALDWAQIGRLEAPDRASEKAEKGRIAPESPERPSSVVGAKVKETAVQSRNLDT
jgi:hypothetical protein